MDNDKQRSRTFHWSDPAITAQHAKSMAGIDFLLAINKDEFQLPPSLLALGIPIPEVESGRVTFFFEPMEYHYNPIGCVHGGIITTILDSAMGCTVHSLLPKGSGYTTLELKVNFIKAITIQTGMLKAIGKIVHFGGKIVLVEASMIDNSGVVYAHAVSTCMIFKV